MNDHPSPSFLTPLNVQLTSQNLKHKAVDKLGECLQATHSSYDLRSSEIITTPDYQTRLAAVVTVLAYTDGRPVERRELITRH